MSVARDNPADALPDPLFMTGRETGTNSTCTGVRPTTGSSDSEVIANTFGTVIVVVASTTTEATSNSTALGFWPKFELRYLLSQCLPQDPPLELPHCSLQAITLNISGNDENESIQHVSILLPS